ncbi:hypothetical protein DXG01_015443 [Tephrocybe rancida]|nr:hypothetical protein DXG01_015443 [Tephrocybe rancida]
MVSSQAGMDDVSFINHGHHFGQTVSTFGDGIFNLIVSGHHISNLLARQVDVTSLTEVNDMLGLQGLEREKWGFNHPVTGSLLCPIALEWDDPK